MKQMRILAWLLVVAMLTMACPAFGEAVQIESVELTGEIDLSEGDLDLELPGLDLPGNPENALTANGDAEGLYGEYLPRTDYDNDALFAGYVDMLFGKNDTLGIRSNGWAGDRLTGPVAAMYNYLLKQIEKVASGAISNTQFVVPESVVSRSDANEVCNEMGAIIDALLVDCPYHLFWYDKTRSTYYGYNGSVYVDMPVADEFARGAYETDAARIRTARTAANKAKSVVKKYAGASDYDKLCAYRDFICKAAEYNNDAASSASMPYGNPWQLVWVFDSDPSTNIVCEGYAKAFQYLCDLSAFSGDIQSHIIGGYAYQPNGSGPHMWNIVKMDDGRNYHVDVTFVDSGAAWDFLCGAESTEYDDTYLVNREVYYQINPNHVQMYPASVLKLSTGNYTPGAAVAPKSVKLKKGSATLKKGQKLTLKRGKSLTLKAVITPSRASSKLTWKSSYKYVTVKDGKVTVNKKAKVGKKAKITVTTGNGKSTYIYIVVK